MGQHDGIARRNIGDGDAVHGTRLASLGNRDIVGEGRSSDAAEVDRRCPSAAPSPTSMLAIIARRRATALTLRDIYMNMLVVSEFSLRVVKFSGIALSFYLGSEVFFLCKHDEDFSSCLKFPCSVHVCGY